MKIIALIITIYFVFCGFSYADIFKLKSGEIIEGELVGEEIEYIKIKVRYGIVTVDRNQLLMQKEKKKKTKIPIITDIASIIISIPPLVWISEATTRGHLQGMYKWLVSQTDQKTGLVESFRPTDDVLLERQASTYDQGLAGLSYLISGDKKMAEDILDFYNKNWDGDGFCNFYYTPNGSPGIEKTKHLGPNMWIALLALHYGRIEDNNKYQDLAKNIVLWAMGLPHYNGGTAMSDKDEWRAKWSKVVSTENNIDYYAVLRMLSKKENDLQIQNKIKNKMGEIKQFLTKTAYDKETGGIFRGYQEGIVDKEYALDTITWLISAIGISGLRRWGIDPNKLIIFAEERFLVEDEGIRGFDFTDQEGAFKAKRARMVSIEWTLEMVNVYCINRNYYYKSAEEHRKYKDEKKVKKLYQKSRIYEHKARFYLKEMDKKMLKFGPRKSLIAYPYATRSYWLVFYDSPWWKTPKDGANGEMPGSAASTSWRIFATRFNPLNINGKLE